MFTCFILYSFFILLVFIYLIDGSSIYNHNNHKHILEQTDNNKHIIPDSSHIKDKLDPNFNIKENSNTNNKMKSQSGILVEGSTDAYFGLFNVNYELLLSDNSRRNSFIHNISQFQTILSHYSSSIGTPVVGSIGFGKKLWDYISETNNLEKNTNLIDFPGYGDNCKPVQCDIFIHIHSIRHDLVMDAGCTIINRLNSGGILKLFEETYGFRYKDSRDLTGFIDGTKNPSGNELRSLAALDSNGNSYSVVQRFIHSLDRWNLLSLQDQESVIGRTKNDSVEFKDKLKTSHVSRVDIKNESGKGMKIVRHSLPYGYPYGDKGLFFTAYCNNLNTFDMQFKSMFGLRDEHKDNLMEYTSPANSGYYYIPNEDILINLK